MVDFVDIWDAGVTLSPSSLVTSQLYFQLRGLLSCEHEALLLTLQGSCLVSERRQRCVIQIEVLLTSEPLEVKNWSLS